jgi:hypothetical protein
MIILAFVTMRRNYSLSPMVSFPKDVDTEVAVGNITLSINKEFEIG